MKILSLLPTPEGSSPTSRFGWGRCDRRVRQLVLGIAVCGAIAEDGHAQSASRQVGARGSASAQREAMPLNGWAFDIEIAWAVAGMDTAAKRDSTITGRGQVSGLDARFDVLHSNDRDVPMGSWVITADGGRSLLVVNPAVQRFYRLMNGTTARAFMESKRISVQVLDLRVRGDTLGACGTIDSHTVNCFRLTREYTMKARYFLFNQVVAVRESIDFWVSTALPGMSNPAAFYLADLTTFPGDDPAAELRAQQTRARLFDGVPLKILRVDIQTSEKVIPQGSTGDTTTVTLRNISRAAVDRRQFVLPSNIRFRR